MTFDEYQQAALRTASSKLGPDLEMCVRALGLCGEAAELDAAISEGVQDEILNETGDVLWYLATLADSFGVRGRDFGLIDDLSIMEGFSGTSLQTLAGSLAELVKKQVGHRKPASFPSVCRLVSAILDRLAISCDLGDAALINVAKLKARYPAGFDLAIASKKPDSNEPTTTLCPAFANGDPCVPMNDADGECRWCGAKK